MPLVAAAPLGCAFPTEINTKLTRAVTKRSSVRRWFEVPHAISFAVSVPIPLLPPVISVILQSIDSVASNFTRPPQEQKSTYPENARASKSRPSATAGSVQAASLQRHRGCGESSYESA
jgi:hypothetical protein